MGIKYNTKFAQKNDLTIHFTPIYETESYKRLDYFDQS